MISVVMPTHKKPHLFRTTILSVLSQSYDCFEFVVVDASSDSYFEKEYWELVKNDRLFTPFRDRFDKVKIIRPKDGHEYPGLMKMTGASHCVQDNDFCIFLDHDDFLYNDMLANIHNAFEMFPDTEMFSMDYTSMIYYNGHVFDNKKTMAGGNVCGTLDSIYINNVYYKFAQPQNVYRNMHPFKAAIHPKIISKNAIRSNRFMFITDTETMDDFAYPVMSHALKETCIHAIGYVYVGYYDSNSVMKRKISKTAEKIHDVCEEYENMLTSMNYVKRRNVYNSNMQF